MLALSLAEPPPDLRVFAVLQINSEQQTVGPLRPEDGRGENSRHQRGGSSCKRDWEGRCSARLSKIECKRVPGVSGRRNARSPHGATCHCHPALAKLESCRFKSTVYCWKARCLVVSSSIVGTAVHCIHWRAFLPPPFVPASSDGPDLPPWCAWKIHAYAVQLDAAMPHMPLPPLLPAVLGHHLQRHCAGCSSDPLAPCKQPPTCAPVLPVQPWFYCNDCGDSIKKPKVAAHCHQVPRMSALVKGLLACLLTVGARGRHGEHASRQRPQGFLPAT